MNTNNNNLNSNGMGGGMGGGGGGFGTGGAVDFASLLAANQGGMGGAGSGGMDQAQQLNRSPNMANPQTQNPNMAQQAQLLQRFQQQIQQQASNGGNGGGMNQQQLQQQILAFQQSQQNNHNPNMQQLTSSSNNPQSSSFLQMPQQQASQSSNNQNPNFNNAVIQLLTSTGEKGLGILKQYQDGSLSPEQLTSLRSMVISRHQQQQAQQNALRQQQQQQQQQQQPTPNLNPNPNPMANVSDEHLLKGTQEMMVKLAKMQRSIANGQCPPEQLEKAKSTVGMWTKQLAQATAECSKRGLAFNLDPSSGGDQFNSQQASSSIRPTLSHNPSASIPLQFPNNQSGPDLERSQSAFLTRLSNVWRDKGVNVTSLPSIEGKPIDLFKLYQTVTSCGGSDQVSNQNLWPVVGAHQGLPIVNGNDKPPRSSPANQLAAFWTTYLSDFEQQWLAQCREQRNALQSHPASLQAFQEQIQLQQQRQHQQQQQQLQLQQQQQLSSSSNPSNPSHLNQTNNLNSNNILKNLSDPNSLPAHVINRLVNATPDQLAGLKISPDIYRKIVEHRDRQRQEGMMNGGGGLGNNSPQPTLAQIQGLQAQPMVNTAAWLLQQQQQQTPAVGGSSAMTQGGGALVGAGGGPAGNETSGPKKPTAESLHRASVLYKEEMHKAQARLSSLVINIDNMSDQEKAECSKALASIQPLLADAEKAAIMYRALHPEEAPQRVLVKLVEMVATNRQAAHFASTGIFTQHTKTVEQARMHLVKFIQHVRAQATQNGSLKPSSSSQAQQSSQPPNPNASSSIVPLASNDLPLAVPSPNAFVPPATLRREDLRAPPAKRARNSSSGDSPAAMYGTGNTPTPIVLDGPSPASDNWSPPPTRKDSISRPSHARASLSTASNNNAQSSMQAGSQLGQVQEQTEAKRLSGGGNEMTGVADDSSILGLHMEESDRTRIASGGLQQQRSQQQPDTEKDPVAFFESQWSRLQAAQSSDPQVLTRAMHDLRRQSLQSTNLQGSPNAGSSSSTLNSSNNFYSQPPNHASPYGTSSNLPMFNLAAHQRQQQQQQQQQQHRYQQPQPNTNDSVHAMAKAEEESFDISFFIDSSQYLDEEDQSRPPSPKPRESFPSTSDLKHPSQPRPQSSSSVSTHPPPPITPSAALNHPNPATMNGGPADDAQTPDLLHSSFSSNGGAQHDESPASTKEALSPHPILHPFRPTTASSSSSTAQVHTDALSGSAQQQQQQRQIGTGGALGREGGVAEEKASNGLVGDDGEEGEGRSTWMMGEQAFYGLGDDFAWEGGPGGDSGSWLIN